MRKLLALFCLLMASFVLRPLHCHAQQPPVVSGAEPADYRAAIAIGSFEYKVIGNFAEARDHFLRAHALFPTAQSLLGLGLSELELRMYPDSVAHLEQALDAQTEPLAADARKSTERVLVVARGFVLRASDAAKQTVRLPAPRWADAKRVDASDGGQRWYKSPWLWSAVGVALLGAALVTGLALGGREPRAEQPALAGSTGVVLSGPP